MALPCSQPPIAWRTQLAETGTGPSRPNKNTATLKIMKSYEVVINTVLRSGRSTTTYVNY